jgi:hypothetical protein
MGCAPRPAPRHVFFKAELIQVADAQALIMATVSVTAPLANCGRQTHLPRHSVLPPAIGRETGTLSVLQHLWGLARAGYVPP